MARTIAQIQAQMDAEQALQPALSSLNSISQVAIYTLWKFVISTSIWIQESLWDIFETNLEAQIALAPAWTDAWVQSQAFTFQYDSITPQVLTLNNFVPSYAVVDATKRIISRCSVLTKPNRIVSVKVATLSPPQALSGPELTSFQGFLDEISPAGVQYLTQTFNPDQLLVGATILYNGQYASTISASTINSINTYMANIEFDGYVRLSALETAILATPGVNDVIFNNIAIRPDSLPFASTTYLVLNNDELFNKYQMYAGYCISEQTSTHTLADTLVFTIGN